MATNRRRRSYASAVLRFQPRQGNVGRRRLCVVVAAISALMLPCAFAAAPTVADTLGRLVPVGSTTLSITGTNFDASASVLLGATGGYSMPQPSSVTVVSSTQLAVSISALASGVAGQYIGAIITTSGGSSGDWVGIGTGVSGAKFVACCRAVTSTSGLIKCCVYARVSRLQQRLGRVRQQLLPASHVRCIANSGRT